MTLVALATIAMVAAVSLLLVQSANATNVMTSTTEGEVLGAEEALSTTITTNNNSYDLLGSLFLIGEDDNTRFNPINETFSEISFVNNVTIMPPNATAGTTINATETGKVTVNVQPNGLSLGQGQSLIMTEGDDDSVAQENATTTFVAISRTNSGGTGSETLLVFFSTNSTRQLAFLGNMLAIAQFEFSPEGGTIRMWEWKVECFHFENGSDAAPISTRNKNIGSSTPQEEG